MQLFRCGACGQTVFFQNITCERCGAKLAYRPDAARVEAVEPAGDGRWCPLGGGPAWRDCANAVHGACNWLVPDDDPAGLCRACRLNHTIPDLTVDRNLQLWQRIELAKHQLVYSLDRFGLPVTGRDSDPAGLAFDFLADPATGFHEGPQVMTGHAEGLITLNIAEADPAARERTREDMAEPYRTLVGHLRHESGHHYWEKLIRDSRHLDACRALLGDERQDYGESLQRHYAEGPPADWQARHVSTYATAHPWEDWAETWAHLFHLVDTLDTAVAFGLHVEPPAAPDVAAPAVYYDPYRHADFDRLVAAWLPVILAVNSLNRSMGQPDLYPFVLAPAVLDKLRFVHAVVRGAAG